MISKEELIKEVEENFDNQVFDTMYISRSTHNIKDIISFDEQVFKNVDKNLNGWLLFYDKCNAANWGHDCSYIFVVDKDNYIVRKEIMPPNDIELEKINCRNVYIRQYEDDLSNGDKEFSSIDEALREYPDKNVYLCKWENKEMQVKKLRRKTLIKKHK